MARRLDPWTTATHVKSRSRRVTTPVSADLRRDPHYWLGFLAHEIARALRRHSDRDLGAALSAFTGSPACTAALRESLREERR